MRRREFLQGVGLSVVGLAVSGCGGFRQAGGNTSKPNIVFIMADDLG